MRRSWEPRLFQSSRLRFGFPAMAWTDPPPWVDLLPLFVRGVVGAGFGRVPIGAAGLGIGTTGPNRVIGSRERTRPAFLEPYWIIGAGLLHGQGKAAAFDGIPGFLHVQRSVLVGDLGGVRNHDQGRDFHGLEAPAEDTFTNFIDDNGGLVEALGGAEAGEAHEITVALEGAAAALDVL